MEAGEILRALRFSISIGHMPHSRMIRDVIWSTQTAKDLGNEKLLPARPHNQRKCFNSVGFFSADTISVHLMNKILIYTRTTKLWELRYFFYDKERKN